MTKREIERERVEKKNRKKIITLERIISNNVKYDIKIRNTVKTITKSEAK